MVKQNSISYRRNSYEDRGLGSADKWGRNMRMVEVVLNGNR